MLHYPLNKNYTLSFETEGKKVRLVILDQDDERACRRESGKKLQEFLSADESQTFKGRLRLLKQGEEVSVFLKDECIGIVSRADFSRSLDLLKASTPH
jgi:hypothetical protein